MLRMKVALMVILSLCIVKQSISHPGDGADVEAEALCSWDQPDGQGDGEITLKTKVSFEFGTHNTGDEHTDGGHQIESLQNRSLHKISGEQVYFIYYYDLKEYIGRVPGNMIVFDPEPYVRSAEQCYDCYSYAHGKFRWGDTKIYSSPTDTASHRVCLSPLKCSSPQCWPQASAAPENQAEAFHELRLAVEYDRVSNPLVTGPVNINGIIHTHTGDRNQEFDADAGVISGVTSSIPATPPKPRVKPISVLWGSLKPPKPVGGIVA